MTDRNVLDECPVPETDEIKLKLSCDGCGRSGWVHVPMQEAEDARRNPPPFLCLECQTKKS